MFLVQELRWLERLKQEHPCSSHVEFVSSCSTRRHAGSGQGVAFRLSVEL